MATTASGFGFGSASSTGQSRIGISSSVDSVEDLDDWAVPSIMNTVGKKEFNASKMLEHEMPTVGE